MKNEMIKTAINDTIKLLETIQPVEYDVQDVEKQNQDVIYDNTNFININENVYSESNCKDFGALEKKFSF